MKKPPKGNIQECMC